MDLNELHNHAKRYGRWTMQLSATQNLVCKFARMPTGNPRYSYTLNGKPITVQKADSLIEAAFERAMA